MLRKYYLHFFTSYSIPNNVIEIVNKDIETRIYSLLSRWTDIVFRRVLLTTGLEEATFYEPNEDLELKCFVVVVIRNSLFENLVSNRKAALELGRKDLLRPAHFDEDVEGNLIQFNGLRQTYLKAFKSISNLMLN